MCVSKVQHITGRKTGFLWFFDFSTNIATGNWKNSEFVQPQLVVRSFAVGFSSISVFFPVQQTGPANTTDNECAYGWSHQQPIDALSSVVPLLGPISCPVEESAAFITLRGLQWRRHHASQEYPRFYLQSQKRRTGGAHTKGSKGVSCDSRRWAVHGPKTSMHI